MDWLALSLSFKLALTTWLVLLPVGFGLARWLARQQFAAKAWVESAIMLPLVLPPTVLGFYLLTAFSPNSLLGQWTNHWLGHGLAFHFSGLLIASLIFNLPFMVQPIQRALEAIPKELTEAAQISGLSGWQRFWHVEWPLAWPGVVTASLLTFVHTLGEFGVVLMIGGSIPGETQTLSIAIYDAVQGFDMAGANQMALTLLSVSLVGVAMAYLLVNRKRRGLAK